jgi:hypothetical protein
MKYCAVIRNNEITFCMMIWNDHQDIILREKTRFKREG